MRRESPRRRPAPPRTSQRILECAVKILWDCSRRSRTLDDALDAADESIRRVLEHLLMNCFRYRKSLDKQISACCTREPDEAVRFILTAALVQCRFQSGIVPESAVNVAVEVAKKYHASSFVNAVLRKLLSQEAALPASADEVLPDFLLERWRKRFAPGELAELARLYLTPAEFVCRVLPGFTAVPESTAAPGFGDFNFVFAPAKAVLTSETFAQGGYYVQDAATSMVIAELAPHIGNVKNALDICAAPGGKTLMLGELLGENVQITATDISARRQQLTKENFALRKRTYRVLTTRLNDISGKFDLVLADVPCSNTGVFRRRPDALWRFDRESLDEVCRLQKEIVVHAAGRVAPQGVLAISTCSIEEDENNGAVEAVLTTFPEFELLSKRLLLPTDGHDGAFAAILKRR